jgi:DNA-binding transcriptional LysR family regulator
MDKLRALEYFIAAAEEGSFSGAARRLDVSVPSIAKLIGSLETHLGARLIDRSTQGLKLTARGEAYLEACLPLVRQLADADQLAADSGGPRERTLIVGAPGLATRLLLVPALAQFRARHPGIQIDCGRSTASPSPMARSRDSTSCWPSAGRAASAWCSDGWRKAA